MGLTMNTGRYTTHTGQQAERGKSVRAGSGRGLTLSALRELEAWDDCENDRQCAVDQMRGVLGAAGLRALVA